MRLIRTGRDCRLELDDPRAEAVVFERARQALHAAFCYRVAGAEFSQAFQEHRWDGMKRLVRRAGKGLKFPFGLFEEATALLGKARIEVEMVDRRPKSAVLPALAAWSGPELYPHQRAAVHALRTRGFGIAKMPIRSGKTVMAARLISESGRRALCIVPSQLLLGQFTEELRRCLPRAAVTCCGDGEKDLSGDVVVTTVQTLCRLAARLNDDPFGVVVVDELHHINAKGAAWYEAVNDLDAGCKFGCTATLEPDREGRHRTAVLQTLGAVGPVVYEMDINTLIEQGYLVRPRVRFLQHATPGTRDRSWSAAIYKRLVVDAEPRNHALLEAVAPHVAAGRRTLIDVYRVAHARQLYRRAAERFGRAKVAVLTGASSPSTRASVLRAFREGSILLVVGNLLGEGIDLPELEVVVNAEGGKSAIATMQRMRNLTRHDGKTEALVLEVADLHHPRLADWTEERLQLYLANPAFIVEAE